MKVYVIEQGEYSDRHVVGVVENEEDAKRICEAIGRKWHGKTDTGYLEFDTEQFTVNKQLRFIVYCYDSWREKNHWVAEYDTYDFYKQYPETTMDYEGHYIVYAKDSDHAIKIAQDMDAEYRAKKEGIAL